MAADDPAMDGDIASLKRVADAGWRAHDTFRRDDGVIAVRAACITCTADVLARIIPRGFLF